MIIGLIVNNFSDSSNDNAISRSYFVNIFESKKYILFEVQTKLRELLNSNYQSSDVQNPLMIVSISLDNVL